MFASRPGPRGEQVREESTRLLIERTRTGLWICLATTLVFGTSNVIAGSEPLSVLLGIKILQIGLIAGYFRLLHVPAVVRQPVPAILFAIAGISLTTAAAGIVYGDFVTTSLLLLLLAFVTAMTFPWGAMPQGATATIAAAAMVWNVSALGGSIDDLGYTAIAVFVAIAASVYIATELDRSRRLIASQIRELRGYRDIVESASEGILSLDPELRVTGANRSAGAILGVTGNDLLGRSIADLVKTRGKTAVFDEWRSARPEELHGRIDTVESIGSDGEALWLEIAVEPLLALAPGGGFQIFLRDVSERKTLDRMRNDFVAMLSHDIKNPLGVILGFVEVLDDGHGRDNPELREMLGRISSNARQALDLADNFVNTARIDSGALSVRPEPNPLNEIVLAAVRDQQGLARPRGVTLESRLSPGLPNLLLDRKQMDRVVANLVGNAIKFSPKGGVVSVETKAEDGSVVLRVRDQGPGVAANERDQLFSRFVRFGNRDAPGSGLGLFIVRKIVEAHGGRVAADFPTEGGSVLSVRLPAPS